MAHELSAQSHDHDLAGLWRFPRLLGSVHIVGWLCMDLEIL
jgi:hypothetical protein